MEEKNLFENVDTKNVEFEETNFCLEKDVKDAANIKGENLDLNEESEDITFSLENLKKDAPSSKGEKKELPVEFYTKINNKVNEKYNGKIFTIKKVGLTKIKNKDFDGNKIEPELHGSGSSSYKVKLKILYEEENLVEFYPSLRFFVNDGKISKVPFLPRVKISEIEESENDQFTSQVGLIFAKFSRHIGKELKNISDYDFFTGLVGKKVKIKQKIGKYKGEVWKRNDIDDFVN